jgi:ABC-type Fe3+-hydroxamate transport system substrate-binding protein
MVEIRHYLDQLGRRIGIPFPPRRIISLVPSQTEFLYDLGLEIEVVAITKFCIHPKEWYETKTRIGGTKNLNYNDIKSLKPDLIIANKEENDQNQIEQLAKDYPVWISDIKDISSALDMISSVAKICDRSDAGNRIHNDLENELLNVNLNLGTAIYFIWNKPLMTAGLGTFISEMMKLAGFQNVIKQDRYPEVSQAKIQELNPEFILLSSEPFPFKEEHQKSFQSQFPESRVLLVDGEIFSWYGSRLLKATEYFKNLANDLSTSIG